MKCRALAPFTPLAALMLCLGVPHAAGAQSSEYVVKEGETLGGIANRTGVSSRAIIEANGLKEPYHVRIGQKLAIPRAATAARSAPRNASVHVVTEGETLGGVANRTGVSASSIIEANNLAEPYHLRAGQRLSIPGARTHLVKDGDTGFGLAYEYGVPFSAIAEANGLDENATLRTGQRLVIPAVSRPAAPAAPKATATATPSVSSPPPSRIIPFSLAAERSHP